MNAGFCLANMSSAARNLAAKVGITLLFMIPSYPTMLVATCLYSVSKIPHETYHHKTSVGLDMEESSQNHNLPAGMDKQPSDCYLGSPEDSNCCNRR